MNLNTRDLLFDCLGSYVRSILRQMHSQQLTASFWIRDWTLSGLRSEVMTVLQECKKGGSSIMFDIIRRPPMVKYGRLSMS